MKQAELARVVAGTLAAAVMKEAAMMVLARGAVEMAVGVAETGKVAAATAAAGVAAGEVVAEAAMAAAVMVLLAAVMALKMEARDAAAARRDSTRRPGNSPLERRTLHTQEQGWRSHSTRRSTTPCKTRGPTEGALAGAGWMAATAMPAGKEAVAADNSTRRPGSNPLDHRTRRTPTLNQRRSSTLARTPRGTRRETAKA